MRRLRTYGLCLAFLSVPLAVLYAVEVPPEPAADSAPFLISPQSLGQEIALVAFVGILIGLLIWKRMEK